MHPALILSELVKHAQEGLTKKQLTDFYTATWKEAYKEGQRDAKETCGCQKDD